MTTPSPGTGTPGDSRFQEDLRWIAIEAFSLSDRLCEACGHMHALWSYIRLARASTGAEGGPTSLPTVLTGLIDGGRRSILVAGSQGTGLLTIAARACAGRCLDIVLLDRCEAPLELCRRLAGAWSLPIETMHEDLTNFDVEGRFDIVLVHGTLHYVPADRRADVLARLRRALRPDGRLVLLFNVSFPVSGDSASENREAYADGVLAELDRMAVPVPEDRDAFRARLCLHAAQREGREGAFGGPEEVDGLLADAGFVVCDRIELGVTLAEPVKDLVAKIQKRRFLSIAKAKVDD
jgi:SAM-dependent methyltransferase